MGLLYSVRHVELSFLKRNQASGYIASNIRYESFLEFWCAGCDGDELLIGGYKRTLLDMMCVD